MEAGTVRLRTRAATISKEKNNEPNFTLRDIRFSFSASAPLADDWRRQAKLSIACFFGLACAMKAALRECAGSSPNHNGFKAGPGAHAQEYEWFGQLCF